MEKFLISKGRRTRETPYTSRIEKQGLTSYTVYNHMLLPTSFGPLEESYYHLKKHVQIWDVAGERQVEIKGKDSSKLVQLMTCRDLSKSKIGRCYYCPIIDDKAGLINDPVILKLDEEKWWISIADSDVILFAKGLAIGHKFDVNIIEPNVDILAVQGPRSDDLMAKLFGEDIRQLKFFNFKVFDFLGTKQIIARSGYSKQDGFEIYFKGFEKYFDGIEMGEKLWDTIWEAGKKFNISPGCPNLIDRIEGGLMSYGNDFTRENNPFECNLEKYCKDDVLHDFIGKQALTKIKNEGIKTIHKYDK